MGIGTANHPNIIYLTWGILDLIVIGASHPLRLNRDPPPDLYRREDSLCARPGCVLRGELA
jgi:hypothetical protein